MNPSSPLPEELRGAAFGPAAARRSGVGGNRLRRRDLHRPFHGVRTSTPPETLVDLCRAYAAVRLKPGQFFSHSTAAALHGLSLPDGLDGPGVVHVSAVLPADAPHARNTRGHRLSVAAPVVLVQGLPVADQLDAFCQLGSMLDVEDLLIVADELLNSAGVDEGVARSLILERVAATRRIGGARLVRAVSAARPGSRSPAESRIRFVLDAARVPGAELNAPILETGTGRYLGSPDFVWRAQRVVLEYEGEDHRTRRSQFRYDIVRYDDLVADGWRVVRATGDHLTADGRKDLVRRVRRAIGI